MFKDFLRRLLERVGEFLLDHIPNQVADYSELEYPDYWKEVERKKNEQR